MQKRTAAEAARAFALAIEGESRDGEQFFTIAVVGTEVFLHSNIDREDAALLLRSVLASMGEKDEQKGDPE
jgi:hypothetical protein